MERLNQVFIDIR